MDRTGRYGDACHACVSKRRYIRCNREPSTLRKGTRMMRSRTVAVCAAFILALACGSVSARGHGSGYSHSGYHYTSRTTSHYRTHAYSSGLHYSTRSRSGSHPFYSRHPNTRAAYGVRRDAHGRIARSPEARRAFERQHPCPSTGRTSGRCPGYVIDHVRALKRGGPDDPSNMQWQTIEDAKAKDRTE